MIIFFVLAAIIVAAALSLQHYHWRHGATAQYVLAVLPAALLFVILPIPALMFSTIRGFQRIAENGTNSYSAAGVLSLEINRVLWLGSLGVLITMVVAGLMQWRGSGGNSDGIADETRTWRDWILLGCALLVLPAALLAYVAGEVPRTLVGAMAMITGGAPSPVPSSELGNLSAKISNLLITGFLGGLLLALTDLFAAAGAVYAASGIRQPRRTAPSAWVMLTIVLLGATWNALQLRVERRWIERVTASASLRGPQAR